MWELLWCVRFVLFGVGFVGDVGIVMVWDFVWVLDLLLFGYGVCCDGVGIVVVCWICVEAGFVSVVVVKQVAL